ncbi:putative methyltransferase-like protein 7A [Biomphalaria glabrata]|uniref:Methyltransferase-like protein 7A n=1 Tax=Biomphalaria glabrata TaxID=6526 RepID=A0A9U8ELK1_BIOGL|nr:putative methyltransferase-like protein 7A [Biomphalaria glabrata]
MAEADAELHNRLIYYVLPTIIVCYITFRWCGFKKAKFQAFLCNLVCSYVHNKFCKKEKTLLFDQMKNYEKSRSKTHAAFTILEIGAGSGMNFKFFPSGSEVTCLDPNPYNEKYIIDNLRKADNNIRLVKFIKGFAENMPDVPSDNFDAVVCTFTMCSIRRLNDAVEEIKRILKPGGHFFYLEHVAAPKGSWIRYFQDKLQCIWPYISDGCNINRETWNILDHSNFKEVQYCHFSASTWLAFFARPGLYGSAIK